MEHAKGGATVLEQTGVNDLKRSGSWRQRTDFHNDDCLKNDSLVNSRNQLQAGVYPLNEQGENMKDSMMRTLLMLLLAVFITAFTAGCNTIEGMGEDIETGGDKIEEATD